MIVVIVLLALGMALGRWRALPEHAAATLDTVVLGVSLPALILREVPKLRLDASALIPLGAVWLQFLLAILAVYAAARIWGWDRKTLGTLLIVVPLGNTSFFGLPAVEAVAGRAHLGPALVYDQLGSFIGLTTWASFVAARYGRHSGGGFRPALWRMLTFPPFLALVGAMILRAFELPQGIRISLDEILNRLAETVVPMTMLAIGIRLKLPRTEGALAPLGFGLGVRLAALPAILFGIAAVSGLRGTETEAAVLESAMPSMVTAGIVASGAGLDEELASGLIGIGILIALVTVPGWGWLLGL